MYTFHEELPSVESYNRLRECVGWGALDCDAVEYALSRSIYAVVAKYQQHTVAFARMVGDGKLCFYIQEIIVQMASCRILNEIHNKGEFKKMNDFNGAILKEIESLFEPDKIETKINIF